MRPRPAFGRLRRDFPALVPAVLYAEGIDRDV